MKCKAILGLVLASFVLSLALPEAGLCAYRRKPKKPNKPGKPGKHPKGKKMSNPVFTKTAPKWMRFAAYKVPRDLGMSFWVKNLGQKTAKTIHIMVRGLGKAVRWKSKSAKIVNLKPGEIKIAVCHLYVPKGTPKGKYAFRAVLISNGAKKLSKSRQIRYRTRSGSVTVKSNPYLPDLQVWGVKRMQVKKRKHVPIFRTGWIKHVFYPTIKNTGKAASKPTTLKIYTWTWLRKKLPGMKKGKHHEFFQTLKVPALRRGQKVTLKCSKSHMCVYEMPVNAIFKVDPDGKVPETNERNNVFVSRYGYGCKKVGIFVAKYKGAPSKSRK